MVASIFALGDSQGGALPNPTALTGTVTYPIAYTNFGTAAASPANGKYHIGVSVCTTTSFKYDYEGQSSAITFRWLSAGY